MDLGSQGLRHECYNIHGQGQLMMDSQQKRIKQTKISAGVVQAIKFLKNGGVQANKFLKNRRVQANKFLKGVGVLANKFLKAGGVPATNIIPIFKHVPPHI